MILIYLNNKINAIIKIKVVIFKLPWDTLIYVSVKIN